MEYSSHRSRAKSSWLHEPIVASSDLSYTRDYPFTQINLIDRITVTTPNQSDDEKSRDSARERRRRRRSSSEERHHRVRPLAEYDISQVSDRRSRSSSEERHYRVRPLDNYDDNSQVSDRRSRSSSEEKRKIRSISSESDDKDVWRHQSHIAGTGERMMARNVENYKRTRDHESVANSTRYDRSEAIYSHPRPSTDSTRHNESEKSYTDHKTKTTHFGESEQSYNIYKDHKSPTHPNSHRDQSTIENTFTYDGKLRLQDGSLPKGTVMDYTSNEPTDIDEKAAQQDKEHAVIYAEVSRKDYDGPDRENQSLDKRPSGETGYHELHDDNKPSAACLTPSSLIYAISVTIACFWCFPLGFYAIYRACQIRPRVQSGDFAGAIRASKAGGFWGTLVLVWGALVLGLVILLLLVFTGHL